ncbi:alpha/beta-hydrolase [Periconia macrospinosa]|uniref:Alpha/beta-hydrolase n=1 Tax=Periconia macrospinosa TaxID=97972 RepID=A0A2V1DU04_9PLEO|nr:alpha/beta-hydrolase [Periconia macrospinosa]
MYSSQFALTLGLGLSSIAVTDAAVPHIRSLGAITVLTDNDLQANRTTRTTSAILLAPSTFETAAERCAALNEKLWSPSHSNFSLGLDNALSYTAYINANNGSVYYWIDSPDNSTSCNAITVNGTVLQKPCAEAGPGLCTNSGPITQATQSFPKPDLQVTVQSGNQNFTGYRDFNTFQFRGIRFSPKVERFGYASVYEGPGSVDALKYGPGCLQPPDPRWPEVDEDCHFLNVWTPYLSANPAGSAQRNKLKGVIIWLTGGGNIAGTGGDLEKEGGNLASRGDIVVVSPNYRVGNLGFLPFKDGKHNGNYGVSDMFTALEWTYKNIENFGGDPSRITIWGESAGAVNVRTLLAIPQAKKMIAGAIMQSGPAETGAAGLGTRYETPAEAYERFTKSTLQESGCETGDAESEVACLKAYDATKWWTETGRTPQANNAVIDKKYLFTRGLPLSGPLSHPHNIPVMYGYNRDEWSYYFPEMTTNFTRNLELGESLVNFPLLHLANSSFSPERDPKWATYSDAEKEKAVYRATAYLSTAAIFKCLPHAFAYSAVKNGIFDTVYEFQFNRTYQPARWENWSRIACGRDVPNPDDQDYDKCHAGEVVYNFGNVAQQGWVDRDGLDAAFAGLVIDYWSAFVRTGTMAPEEGYLEARGFESSKKKIEEAGVWTGDSKTAMRLQWTGIGDFSTEEYKVGCDELRLPEDFYENFDFELHE